jgi:ABC-type uncharacterized transport system auxiliary subunit
MTPRWLAAAAILLLGGCFPSGRPMAIREYSLEYTPPPVSGHRLPVSVRVTPFSVRSVYDRQLMVYRDDEYSTGTYFDARWSANPGAMLGDLLARDLAASGLYRGVLHGPASIPGDYHLGGEIEAIDERTTADGCAAQLEVRVLLVRARGTSREAVVLQESFGTAQACRCGNAQAMAAAMSAAAATVSGQVQAAVYTAIARDQP